MKIPIGKNPYVYPIPIALLGANVKGKPNYETVGDFGLMGINPALVCVSSHRDHYTNIGILENGTFSLNFPQTKMLTVTDYCGIVSGAEVDKSALFDNFYGELKTAPMIRECPVSLECRVLHEYSVLHRQMFIAEVNCAYADEEYVEEHNGKKQIADLTRLDPILYALDNRYYSIGQTIGVGYKEGRQLKDRDI
jgi:flavin reductase (DIM6/NTAB) family NADH-FMN oxidoreductase RutF